MNDEDLEGSRLVEGLAWSMHFTWLSVLAAGALFVGVAPLVRVRDSFDNPAVGTAAAIGAGAAFLAVSKVVFDQLKKRWAGQPKAAAPEAEPEPEPEPPEEPSTPSKKRRKRKKRKKR